MFGLGLDYGLGFSSDIRLRQDPQLRVTKIPREHVPKSHVITRMITCDFGTCSCGIFLRVAFHIGGTSTFLYFDLYPNTAYAAHYVNFTIWISNHTSSSKEYLVFLRGEML